MNLPDELQRERVAFFYKKIKRVSLYLVDSKRFREKEGVYTYTAEEESRISWQKQSMGHHDYFAMNLLLQKAALELMILLNAKPDIIHCHDGHTAILPALIREYVGYRSYFRSTGCLVTIHNAGLGYHQEVADLPYAESISGLSGNVIDGHLLDGNFDPFLVAGSYSLLNTVSENYARELQETENDRLTGWLGHQLLYRQKVIVGITNGIDPALFNPAETGDGEGFAFEPGDSGDELTGKRRCKIALLNDIKDGLLPYGVEQKGYLDNDSNGPLFTFVGRLNEQKGVDVFIDALELLMKRDATFQVLLLGNGDLVLEERLIGLTEEEPFRGRVCFLKGYSSELARKIYSGGDFFVIPSRFEPCGLTDFIAQLYGNIPVVHHVGGLVKVKDGYSGIAYQDNSPGGLMTALKRGLELFSDRDAVRTIQLQAVREIKEKYTWSKVMKKYIELYGKAVSN
ncbi:MAG: glycogen/starch synthase [Desulfobulbaceae bacterium]|nr:glycogen/starch synthase [Desulfobulbaceae bacterium]